MKKFITKICIISTVLFLVNCKKNPANLPTDKPTDQNEALYMQRDPSCPNTNGASFVDDMLCFPTMEAIRSSIDDIKRKHYSNTDSTDEFRPSRCFENQFSGFVSLRNHVEGERNAWLNTSDADPLLDPDNNYIPGIGFRTVLNRDGAVKIGNIIYYFLNNGEYYEIEDGSGNKLRTLIKNKSVSGNLTNVNLYKTDGTIIDMGTGLSKNSNSASKTTASCIGWQQKDKTSNYASNRRVKVKIWVWNLGPVGADVDSETENFRKTGVWFKTNANEINSGLCGQIVAGDCFLVGSVCPPLKTKFGAKDVGGHLSIYGGLVRKVESKKLTASGRARTNNTWSSLLNVSIE